MRVLPLLLLLLVPQESLEQRRDRIGERLETIRGLKFKSALPIRESSRKEYAQVALDQTTRVYGGNLDTAEGFLKAMGLIPISMKLSTAVTANAAIGVQIYYADGQVRLIDLGTADDLLLNKMTPGLIDQNFPDAKPAAETFDAEMAFAALRSGDADISKNLMWHSKKLDEAISDDFLPKLTEATEKWEREDSKFKSAVVPRLFVRSGDFGWRRGAIFVETLRQKGGMELVNKAYAKPPASTEHILHPQKYLDGEAPVALDLTPFDECATKLGYGRSYRTTLGEFGVAVFFETQLKTLNASATGDGWAGDTIALYEGNGIWFIVWATEWDTERDAEEFQTQMLKVSQKLLPGEKDLTSVVVRRNRSTIWLHHYKMAHQNDLLDALWNTRRDGKAGYGE